MAVIRGALVVGTVVAAAIAGPAAGGGGPAVVAEASAAPAARPPAPALTRFASCAGFVSHMRRRALPQAGPWGLAGGTGAPPPTPGPEAVRAGAAPALGPAGSPRPGVDFSGTNVQEAGVDEPDIATTDGRTLFALTGRRVETMDVSGGTARRLGGLALTGMSPSGLLLMGDRLLVLGERGGPVVGGPVPLAAAASLRIAPPVGPPATVVVQLDVSDPSRPRIVARLTADGSLVTARRTGQTVRLVVSSHPTRLPLAGPAQATPAARRAATRANRRAIARARAAAWLPRVRVRDVARKRTTTRVTPCRSVSRPRLFSGLGMASVHTVGTAGGLTLLDSDAVLTDAEVVYASSAAMYVATPRWFGPQAMEAGRPPRGTTLVHKLDTSAPSRTTHRASGAVRGHPLNQFSLSEHEGLLRVATTEEPDWWSPPEGEPSQSLVTVLGESAGRLERVGQVDGLGRGERIHSVRFIGDRGYVVTFRQVDPLYVVDLSDPARPAVRGELKIPGFSSYLHPIDDATLIGVGQAADGQGRTRGTQVSLFDVSDPAAPRRIAQRTLDAAWSEAESDHHAFLHWPATGLVVLPAQGDGAPGGRPTAGAVGLNVSRATGITPIARVAHPGAAAPSVPPAPVRRSLVAAGALFTVSEAGVMASDLTTLAPRAWTPFG